MFLSSDEQLKIIGKSTEETHFQFHNDNDESQLCEDHETNVFKPSCMVFANVKEALELELPCL